MPYTVEQRGASEDLLHEVVRSGLPLFLARLRGADRHLPAHVTGELERFVACGDPAEGFAWLVCDGCAHQRLVPFSCKGRGFCPSWHRTRAPTTAEVEQLVVEIAARAEAWLAAQGFGPDESVEEEDDHAPDDPPEPRVGVRLHVLAVPVAAGVLEPLLGWSLSPMLASALMAASSVSVVASSLWLGRMRSRSA